MQGRFIFQWATILFFFVVALVMELAPWPAGFQAFKPSWLVLVLLYWSLALPDRVSIGWAFLLGVLWDIVLWLYSRRACIGAFCCLLFCFQILLNVAQPFPLVPKFISASFSFLPFEWQFSWLNSRYTEHSLTGRKSLVPLHQAYYGRGYSY